MIKEEFHVVMRCPTCQHLVEAWPEEVPRADLSAETAHDAEATTEIELDCETCGESFSATVHAHLGGWEVYLTGDPFHKGTFEHFDYTFDEWIDELEPEPHPRANFEEAIKEWARLLDAIADKRSGSASSNRMLLVQLFSIVEAYFADAIVKLAYDYPSVAAAIIQWHPELKDENVSLKRVATEPNLVRDIVVAQLRKTQFHRFELVNGMLRACLKHHLLPAEKPSRDFVLKSVHVRHDCVHRNGRDPDGKPVSELTTQYLADLASHFTDIVTRLSARIDGGGAAQHAGLVAFSKDPFDQYPEEDDAPGAGRAG